jgi:hypothetical protein
LARTYQLAAVAFWISTLPAISGGVSDTGISYDQKDLKWLVSISSRSWTGITEYAGSELSGTVKRVSAVFRDEKAVDNLGYFWSPSPESEHYSVCDLCVWHALTGNFGECFENLIEKKLTSSGRYSCTRNARELKAAVNRYTAAQEQDWSYQIRLASSTSGSWVEEGEYITQLDEDAPITQVLMDEWVGETTEYSFDVRGLVIGEDNAGALTVFFPGYSVDLVWDPERLGGSGLYAQVYDAAGRLFQSNGTVYSFELPDRIVSGIESNLLDDRELSVRVRVDPDIGEIVVRDPWMEGFEWRLALGRPIGDGNVGVGTKSAGASFGNFSVSRGP